MLKFVILTISIGIACGLKNYCDTDICNGFGFKHITCEITDKFGPQCSDDAKVLEVTNDIKQKIIDDHNKYRNKIAGGEEAGFNTAAKMGTMEWDQTLADYARLNVMRCVFEHDCHNFEEMKYSGQNIWATTDPEVDTYARFEGAISSWYSEIKDANQGHIDKCCENSVGHFLQVVRDKSNKVGCAIAWFSNGDLRNYIACNYSFGNLRGSKNYVSGAPTSGCATGPNPQYPNLCSSAEYYDPLSP